jgi:hypothetical protein
VLYQVLQAQQAQQPIVTPCTLLHEAESNRHILYPTVAPTSMNKILLLAGLLSGWVAGWTTRTPR